MAAQISSTKCNVCATGLGRLFCYECYHFLCDSCNTFHGKFPATKRHCVTDSQKIDRTTSSQLLCDEHQLDFLNYCQTCETLTCSSCVTTNHKGHSFTEIAEITSTSRAQVGEKLVVLKEKILNLSDLIERTKSKDIGFIKKESNQYINSVNQVSDDLTGIVNSITEININRASDYYVTEKQGLEYSVAKLDKTLNEYKVICNKLEQLLLQKHEVAFCYSHKLLEKELSELEDIPDIEEPIKIGMFVTDEYIDVFIEKLQTKYTIRSLKVKDNAIHLLKQSLEQEKVKIRELQQTKDDELAKCRVELQGLETDVEQKTKSLVEKDNEIQHLKESFEQEKISLAKLEQTKDAELVECRKELQRLETDVKKRKVVLKEKDNEIQHLKENVEQGKVSLAKLQQAKDAELVVRQKELQSLETAVKTRTESLTEKNNEIQHLKENIEQGKVSLAKLQQTKDAELVECRKEMQRLETDVKSGTESLKFKDNEIQQLKKV